MSILTWEDLYYQLWTQAAQSRGTVTNFGTPSGGSAPSAMREWPRTNGADAIAIAALVAPILDAIPVRPGGYGITNLWRSAIIDVESVAFLEPTAEYALNPSLWAALLAVAAHLDTIQAALPDEDATQVLLDGLWSPAPRRNAGEKITSVVESTFEKMWATQRQEYTKLRGADVHEFPPGVSGSKTPIPRTTNADIARLADYWNAQLYGFLPRAPFRANTMGLSGQIKRWNEVRDDVDEIARKGKSDDVYSKNASFWHETAGLATNLAVWGEMPANFDLVLGATKQAVVDLPGRVADFAAAAAKVAGKVAHDVGAGFLSGLGKPLLIGSAAVVGLIVLLRLGRGGRIAQEV